MKITRSLKQRLSFVAFQVVTGQINDLGALAELLQTIADEARQQNER
ncbi:hypothetical protein ACKFKH_32435 [Phormidesmis sp. 146-20]